MLDWLEMQGHWGYISVSLIVTALLIAADLLPPWLRERRLRAEIRSRLRRESSPIEEARSKE